MQTTLLSIAIALILALLAALFGPHVIRWNDHRAFFEAEASRLVGIKVLVGGDIDAALLPFPSVTLRAIAIGPAGEGSRMRARSLRIELELGPLMRGELRATEMRLVAPQFNIGLDSQGQIDWPPLGLGERDAVDRSPEHRRRPRDADRCHQQVEAGARPIVVRRRGALADRPDPRQGRVCYRRRSLRL